jgi:ABC-type uncharacterized transport system substrate-binding protein
MILQLGSRSNGQRMRRSWSPHHQRVNGAAFPPGTDSREIDAAFASFGRERPDAVFVSLDVFLNSRRAQLVNLASRHALPATYSNRDFPEIGGLMSYGTNIAEAFRQIGLYTGRILKGAKPVELPVLQWAKCWHTTPPPRAMAA